MAKPTIRVKVIAKNSRPCLLLRWTDDAGEVREKSSGVPKGEGSREQKANRRIAEAMARELEQRLAGLSSESLESLLDSWREVMESSGASDQHVSESVAKARRAIEGCKFKEPSDITGRALAEWLNRLRAARPTKADPKCKRRISHRTHNAYLEAMKRFCSWLVEEKELTSNPVAYLSRKNEEADRHRIRRAFTPAELSALIEAAMDGPTIERVDGPARAVAYIVSAWTGLRAREIASLTPRSLKLSANPPTITVEARRSKRRTKDHLPLHPDLVERLRAWLASLPAVALDRPLLNLQTKSGLVRRTSKMIASDMRRAKIEAVDASGAVADFHALRHTFITNLALAGVPLVQAQKLARHSDPRLTAQTYTHLAIEEQSRAVNALPPPPTTQPGQKGAG